MKSGFASFQIWLGNFLARLGLGMRAKLIFLFVIIKVVPLVLLALLAWRQSWELGEELKGRTAEISQKAIKALADTGEIAVKDAVSALDARATDEIERMSTDLARRVADFLYSRDDDVLFAATLEPSEKVYRDFVRLRQGRVVRPGAWELAPDGKSWRRAEPLPELSPIDSSIEENDHSFNYRAPDQFAQEARPLYLEMSFVDLSGREKVKVVSSPLMDPDLKDVSDHRNTFIKAERYFEELKKLAPGEVYVSEVIGEYVGTNSIGMYTPENCRAKGVAYEPESQAFAGRENPNGRRFKGLVRWAAPVVRQGAIVGWVTLALDHDHIMEFTDHVVPTKARYSELPDAYEGNYAFIWDHKGRNICHPRHHSIAGYDAATGEPQVPWLEDRIYDDWQASGESYVDFIKDVPVFENQSNSKKPAGALTKAGLVGLDCRYLNFAPQCTGWFDLTRDGGSGSFLILWSGLWKLNTAAAIPYYTGRYGATRRGFGFVAIGSSLTDFHRPATETQKVLNALVNETDQELDDIAEESYRAIGRNLWETATSLTVSTIVMAALVILIAVWIASAFTRSITRLIQGISRFRSGERHFRFNARIKDEIGALADSFDEMADSIVESGKGPLAIVNLERKILYMNDEALRLTTDGTLKKIIGVSYQDISIFPDDARHCPITALLRGREAEPVFHESSGRYFKGSATYLTDKHGEKIGYIIATTDVTELLEEQKRLERQRALLSTIFASSPDLIWYEDDQGRFLAANPRYASLVGIDPDKLKGGRLEDFLPPEVARPMRANDKAAIDGAAALYSEERLLFADGHEETLDVVRTPLYNTKDEYIGLLGVARDVSRRVFVESELRRTQEELKSAAAAANKASDSKSAFLARMSHEIRTPMNAIIGMTNITRRKLAEGDTDNNELLSHVRQIEVSAAHLLGLLNDILDISKIEAGKIELSEESFDLAKLAANVAAIIRPRCQEKSIVFEMQVEGVTDNTRFTADALRLRQVLINLLGNAVKFTPELGTIRFSVRQETREKGRAKIYFGVRDTGIGIPKNIRATLFAPFEQGGGHITRHYGGTGLGLSISRSIVQLMGGDIAFTSEEGLGSDFFFSLWLSCDNSTGESKTRTGDVAVLAGKRMLLVDDVEVNRIIVVEQLSKTGLLIEEAGDGKEAADKFMQSPEDYYDIILMDVQMPHMNGHEASKAIRAMKRADARTIPIIAMTANAFKEDVDRALACGMSGHLAKPVEYERLMEELISFLSTASEQI